MYIWRKRATGNWLRPRSEDLLCRFGGALALIERPGKARTLVEVGCGTRKEALRLQREFGGTIERLRSDWFEQFTKRNRSEPLRIGSRLVVTRTPDLIRPAAKVIVIPAEAAFGTGEHATTSMCLRMLERATRKWNRGWSMLDAGTGSGILAIAGSSLGARHIIAVETDRIACATARRNARANGVHDIEFRNGDVLTEKFREKFDVITANLYSEILTPLVPVFKRSVTRNGCVVLSGILRAQERSLLAALRRNGFVVPEIRRRGKWVALRALPAGKNS